MFVIALDVEHNRVIVGRADELGRRELIAAEVNWIAGEPPCGEIDITAQIRYRARPVPARVVALDATRARVIFDTPLRDITPGQAVVFYDDDVCLGGGIVQ